MIRYLIFIFLDVIVSFLVLISFFAYAAPTTPLTTTPTNPIKRVIYITLDGTRWQDIFHEEGHLKPLWNKYGASGIFYGKPGSQIKMHVASVPISLPSYQSQMTGSVQPCKDNECGRVGVKTMPEHLVTTLGLSKKDVAIFASWKHIDSAVQRKSDLIFTNIGDVAMSDPNTHKPDLVMASINNKQHKNSPGDGDRFDLYTFEQAFHYFKHYKPRFMWIALTDADKAAHENDRVGYDHLLSFYNFALDRLFTMLKDKKMDKDTLVIVTTDHGRGDGPNWTTHGPEYPESKQTWAFAMNGKLMPINKNFSTLSIRPTIENALLAKEA